MADLMSVDTVERQVSKFHSLQVLPDKTCIICYTECNKGIRKKYVDKVLTICSKYLHSELMGNSFGTINTQTAEIPFCENCKYVTLKLSQLHDQLEMLEKQISDLVVDFTLNIVETRKKINVDKNCDSQNRSDENDSSNFNNNNFASSKSFDETQIKIENFSDIEDDVSFPSGGSESEEAYSPPRSLIEDISATNKEKICGENEPETSSRPKRKAAVTAVKNVKKTIQASKDYDETSSDSDQRSNCSGSNESNWKSSTRSEKNEQDFHFQSKSTSPEKGTIKSENFNCSICQKKFGTQHELKKHKLAHTNKKTNGTYKCDVCEKIFARAQALRDHRHVHAEKMPHTCEVCSKGFARSSNYKTHMLIHYGEKTFKCELCDYSAISLDRLKCHKVKRHDGFFNEEERRSLKQWPCGICGTLWNSKSALRTHIFGSHNENEENSENATDENDLKKEIEFSQTENEAEVEEGSIFECGLCRESFQGQKEFKKHTFSHLKKESLSPRSVFSCEVCGKTFKSSKCLKDHFRIHTGEKPFVCPECGRGFASKVNMKHHLLIHTGKKPYVCDICGKSCLRLRNLERHRQITHSFQVPFKCRDCGKPMKCDNGFAKHYRRFHPEIPFSKTDCILTNETLEAHLQGSNSVNIPWKCRDCGKAMKFRTAFRNHYKRFHRGVVFSYSECILKNDMMIAPVAPEGQDADEKNCVQTVGEENSILKSVLAADKLNVNNP